MASSRIPRITLDDMGTLAPSRTPGPLGHKDGAAPYPGMIHAPGDSPGPLGRNDGGETPKPKGTLRSAKTPACERWITLEQAQALALEITTYFEGGEAKYGTLADDGDDQATSFGLLQWNFGQNTLGPILNKMLKADPVRFERCFTPNTKYETLKNALLQNDQSAQKQWARALLSTNRTGWEASFSNLSKVDVFNKIQRDEAIRNYHRLVMRDIEWLRTINPIEFQRIEVNTYAALFDLCVQQYGIGKSKAQVANQINKLPKKSQRDLMILVVTERGRKAKEKYRSDCVSRRMGILTAEPFTYIEKGRRVTRNNPKLRLLQPYRGVYVRI